MNASTPSPAEQTAGDLQGQRIVDDLVRDYDDGFTELTDRRDTAGHLEGPQ